MCERGILRKVCFDGFSLNRRWRLGEKVDDAGYFFDCGMRLDENTEACKLAMYLDFPLQEMRFGNCNWEARAIKGYMDKEWLAALATLHDLSM
jgi:hypothetical protein